MAYAITEYEFWGNPKVREAGKDAVLMYLAGNSYCNQFMTDGLITLAAIPTVANLAFQKNPDKAIKALVDNRLWIKARNGYQVHDYLKHNKSKLQIEDLMKKRSTAGKASARSRVPTDEPTDVDTSVATSVEQVLSVEHLSPSISISNSITNDLKQLTTQQRGENVYAVYEDTFGTLTEFTGNLIKQAVEDTQEEWVIEAIHEADLQNVRKWSYVQEILKNWQKNGYKVDTRQKQPARGNNGAKPTKYDAIVQAGTYEAWSKRGAR